MNRYSDEHIFKYLDQSLTPEQVKEFEQELKNNPELNSAVAQTQKAHSLLVDNSLEKAPAQLSEQVIARVTKISKTKYYRPSGLFSNTSFLLISGVLTALVSFLSLSNAGYIDWQGIFPGLFEGDILSAYNFTDRIISKKMITNATLVIYGVLGLVLLDRFVFNPMFRRKAKRLGFN